MSSTTHETSQDVWRWAWTFPDGTEILPQEQEQHGHKLTSLKEWPFKNSRTDCPDAESQAVH